VRVAFGQPIRTALGEYVVGTAELQSHVAGLMARLGGGA
jgi:hypothetical protein